MAYRIFTDATADLTLEHLSGLPRIEIIPMQVEINEQEYTYGPFGNISVNVFYNLQRQGYFATTSQINPETYRTYFEKCLKQGDDVLYLCFSSGLSGTIQAASICIDELKEAYPQRKIICIDTLCASVGEGLLVLEAARRQAAGMDLEELAVWVTENRANICHWFTVDTFDHLKHGGRVSAVSAAMGTLLGIKPLLHVDSEGKLAAVEKPRGRKKAMSAQLQKMEAGWNPELSKSVFIGHGDQPDAAAQLQELISQRFPEAEVLTGAIGPVIGAHTGPGMLALIYWGDNR